jgi:hypothetical protein
MKSFLLLGLIAIATMVSTPVLASSKLWNRETIALKYRIDLSKSDLVVGTANGAVGTHVLGNLPDEFIINKVYVNAVTALTGGGTLVVGEDGGGDDDGYCLDLDAVALDSVTQCAGALLYTSPVTAGEIGNEKPYKVAATKDGFAYKIATTAYTAGILEFTIIGYQGE